MVAITLLDEAAHDALDHTGLTGVGGGGLAAGAAFPGSPSTNDLYFRTNLGMLFQYDGTRWLSSQLFTIQMIPGAGLTATTAVGDMRSVISATANAIVRAPAPPLQGGSDLWLVSHKVVFNVLGGGTALSGSHKWTGTLAGVDSAGSGTGTVATTTIDSGSSAAWREATTAIGAVRAAGSLWYSTAWTKTGTPGNLETGEIVSFRIIAT